MSNDDHKPPQNSQKTISLHTVGVQVVTLHFRLGLLQVAGRLGLEGAGGEAAWVFKTSLALLGSSVFAGSL